MIFTLEMDFKDGMSLAGTKQYEGREFFNNL